MAEADSTYAMGLMGIEPLSSTGLGRGWSAEPLAGEHCPGLDRESYG